jgi:hypothetical protein
LQNFLVKPVGGCIPCIPYGGSAPEGCQATFHVHDVIVMLNLPWLRVIFTAGWTGKSTSKQTRFLIEQLYKKKK